MIVLVNVSSSASSSRFPSFIFLGVRFRASNSILAAVKLEKEEHLKKERKKIKKNKKTKTTSTRVRRRSQN